MRRIKNVTEEALEVPILGVTVQPGDVATVPDEFDDVEFSHDYWEVDGFRNVVAGETATSNEEGN